MRNQWHAFSIVLTVTAALGLCGCGGPSEIVVNGTVTYEGEPVEKGEILFIPADGTGSVGAGPITDGKFSFVSDPGEKKVEIRANRISDKPAPDGLPNYVPYIPTKYNTNTSLTASVENKPENTFTFSLEK